MFALCSESTGAHQSSNPDRSECRGLYSAVLAEPDCVHRLAGMHGGARCWRRGICTAIPLFLLGGCALAPLGRRVEVPLGVPLLWRREAVGWLRGGLLPQEVWLEHVVPWYLSRPCTCRFLYRDGVAASNANAYFMRCAQIAGRQIDKRDSPKTRKIQTVSGKEKTPKLATISE